nr:FAD-dependent monooxygenase [Streptomyces sp. SID4948]
MLVVDGVREWVVATVADRADTVDSYPPERIRAVLATVLGVPATHPTVATARIRDVRLWSIATRVAEQFVHGRVLRAGDAAHEIPPTGAMGLNLGLADADSLSWRLAAILAGWGDPALLTEYDTERRTVATRTARWARDCFNTVASLIGGAVRGDPAALALGGSRLSGYLDSPGLELGPLLGPPLPGDTDDMDDPSVLTADGRPGSRAPHVGLGPEGGSTLDQYGTDPVLLLRTSEAADPTVSSGAELAAAVGLRCGIPLRILQLPPHAVGEWTRRHGVREEGAALVRPDGYVSWRSRQGGGGCGWDERDLERALLQLATPHNDGVPHLTP